MNQAFGLSPQRSCESHASTVLVGTYPPTQCGIATFTRALASSLGVDRRVGVIDVSSDGPNHHGDDIHPAVVDTWTRGDGASLRRVLRTLNGFDSVILQHEFGIFGGRDGCEVLELTDKCEPPLLAVMHTVVERPSAHQRMMVEQIAGRARLMVTLTETARRRLLRTTSIDPQRIVVIPHGAHEVHRWSDHVEHAPILLTWGLIGPGKGIEHVIDAVALLSDLESPPVYWVVGETHPKVRQVSGESYRRALLARAHDLGVGNRVRFFDGYRDLHALHALIARADLVVLPYDSREQVTSGVLVEAIAAGFAVVATDFPHARELLGRGCGLVVPHEEPRALANAVRRVLSEPELRARLESSARQIAPSLFWPAVGATFGLLLDSSAAEVGRHDSLIPLGATA